MKFKIILDSKPFGQFNRIIMKIICKRIKKVKYFNKNIIIIAELLALRKVICLEHLNSCITFFVINILK